MVYKIVKKFLTRISVEQLVRLSAYITADVLHYVVMRSSVVKDPRVVASITVAVKTSNYVAKRCKRKNFDSTVIFDDSVDAIIDAF